MQLRLGDRVFVHSMVTATDMNTKLCKLLRFEPEKMRWKVRIDGFVKPFWIKETNLSARLQLQSAVTVMHTDNPLTHKSGNVWFLKQRCVERDAWIVSSPAGRIGLMSAEDLSPVLHIGARVLVLALENESLHRKNGTIVGQCNESKMWRIAMQDASVHDALVSIDGTSLAPWPRPGDNVVVDNDDDDDYDGVTCEIAQVFQDRAECLLVCEGHSLMRTMRQIKTQAEDTHTVATEAKALLKDNLPSFVELMQNLHRSTNGQFDVRTIGETLITNTITAWNDEAFLEYAFKARQCQYCCKMIDTSETVRKCSKCTMAYYCDQECQRKDWTNCADTVGDHAGKHRKQCVRINSIALPPRHRQSSRTSNFLIQMLAVMNSSRLDDECGIPMRSRNDISEKLSTFDAAECLFFPCFDQKIICYVPVPMWVYHRICIQRRVTLPTDLRTDHVICAIMLISDRNTDSLNAASYILAHSNVPI